MTPDTLHLHSCGYLSGDPHHDVHRSRPIDNLVIWVISGAGRGQTEGDDHHATTGDLLTFRKGKRHGYGADADQPWAIMWAHFDGRAASAFITALRQGGPPAVRLGVDPHVRSRFDELLIAHRSPHPAAGVHANTCLYSLLGLMVRQVQSPHAATTDEDRLDTFRIQRYIHEHLAAPLTLEQLAAAAKLSPTHFLRLFRERFRMPPMRYVIQQRIAQAATLLEETNQPVNRISRAVGYEDPYYFSRLFKKATGVSPQGYRDRQARP